MIDAYTRLARLGYQTVNNNDTPALIPPMITIPAGPFLMGSDKNKDRSATRDELPQHSVEVAAFQIAKYPVTVAEYALAIGEGVRKPEVWERQSEHLDHPVVNVTWNDAKAYITWLNRVAGQPGWRLPTEAEWEKAARWDVSLGVSRIFPWGDTFDKDRCNTWQSGIHATTPVGSYPSGVSPFGLEDMAGNVWEWTSSLWMAYPYVQNDKREEQSSPEYRVSRGGSYIGLVDAGLTEDARAACRSYIEPAYLSPDELLDPDLGFRLAFGLVKVDVTV